MNILFVCSSNICRSPYCEFHFKRMVKEDPRLAEIVTEVRSAGVLNRSFFLFPKAKRTLLSEGFTKEELKTHKPRFKWFCRDFFENADMIIGMTESHRALTPKKYRDKFTTLTEAVRGEYIPIPDPYVRLTQKRYDEDMKILYGYLVELKDKLIADFSEK